LAGVLSRPALLVPFAVLTVAHLTAAALDLSTAARATQILLMPALALWFATVSSGATDARMRRLTLWALAFSWAGDTVPALVPEDAELGALIGFFMLAQGCFIAAFWPARSDVARRLLPAYVLAWVALEALLLPEAGILVPAVLLYGGLLVSMAFLATGIDRISGIGGVIFMASDTLIALDAFEVWTQPGHDLWVMATYCLAQFLVVIGIARRLHRVGSEHPSPSLGR
jgi:hypothetical protein